MHSLPGLQSETPSSKITGEKQGENNLAGYSFTHQLVNWLQLSHLGLGLLQPTNSHSCCHAPHEYGLLSPGQAHSPNLWPLTKHLSISLKTPFHDHQGGNPKPPANLLQKSEPITCMIHFSLFLNWKHRKDKFGFKMMSKDNRISMQMSHLWLDLSAHACNLSF